MKTILSIIITLIASVAVAQDYWIYNADGSISWITINRNGSATYYGNNGITTIIPSHPRIPEPEQPRYRDPYRDINDRFDSILPY